MKVLADTLGGIEPQPYFSYPARLPADIIADAQRNLVVRDGWASFFFHTYDSISYLQQTVHRAEEPRLHLRISNGCLGESMTGCL